MRFLPIVTQIFLWWAIFDTIGDGQRDSSTIAGYSFSNMVAYYLLSMVSRAFSSMPGLASGIALQIRNGEIKKYLVQPIDMLEFLLLEPHGPQAGLLLRGRAAVRVGLLPLPGLLRGRVARRWDLLACFLAALLMSFLLGFFMEASIGLIGFWFLEVSSLLFVYMLFSFFLSGHMFPLDMLPGPWGRSGRPVAAASTWPITRRRSSWARCRATNCLGAWGRGAAGCCSSSCTARVTFPAAACGVTADLEGEPMTTRSGPSYGQRVSDVRPQQPGARHDVPHELHPRRAFRRSPGR